VTRTLARSLRLGLFLAAAGLVLFGCSSSSKPVATTTSASSPNASGAPRGSAVTIKNFSFSPTPLSAKAGTTITVTNNDTTDHTFTDGGGAFDTGHIAPGTSKTVTLTKAGTYHYHCKIHPFMTGQIDVTS
jgi:plastocyanin